ncbi:4-hydroxyphenylacetate decarboxylase small subunit [Clostridium uliginosum]|uniref:4-hydroxyphenylacetate decarboxylase small subunit n=1 Tax=Clostridium uliginosum TaxID=119641 RepID=A0A1I1N398_9CLOT|nr:4-hydroxyphenylacetate decarboxylase small subunit [Clostridium uliginosum]SFC91905.1 4-hydroxyphenylacetate decarboxylase small subunit [Clostridium uliginosum]
MANESIKHNDCVNFSSIDVAKGICRISNEMVFIDTSTCGNFKEVHKCKNCSNFKNLNKDNTGLCTGLKKEAWTFGELSAVTCEGYKSNKASE